MADEEKKEAPEEPVPPRLDLKSPEASGQAAEAASESEDTEESVPTIRLAAPSRPKTVLLKKGIGSKKETSRIPLEAAKPTPPPEDAKPKTIRIKPAAPVAPGAGAAPAAEEGGAAAQGGAAGKRKTSKIPLEAAISSGKTEKAAPAGKPKTIRLKRPSAGAKSPPTARTIARPAVALKKTAEIEVSEGEAGAPAPTRRKTVRVKRPIQRPTVKPAAIARPAEAAEPAMGMQPVVEDKPLWVFPTMAILSVIAVFVLVYVHMAQVFGPDISLTRHSYGWRGLELSWPGKIARQF